MSLFFMIICMWSGFIFASQKIMSDSEFSQTQAVSKKLTDDSKLPDFARYDYLANLKGQKQKASPGALTVDSVQNFVALASRGFMYALQLPYANHVLSFALLNVKANALQTQLLDGLIKKNIKLFKTIKDIKKRDAFFKLLESIRNASTKIHDTLIKTTLTTDEDVRALRLVAEFAEKEGQIYAKAQKIIEPTFASKDKKVIKTIAPIKQISNAIHIVFDELNMQLKDYAKKQKQPSQPSVKIVAQLRKFIVISYFDYKNIVEFIFLKILRIELFMVAYTVRDKKG